MPLAFLLWQSFFTPQTAAKAAEFTLNNYREAYGSAVAFLFGWGLRTAWKIRRELRRLDELRSAYAAEEKQDEDGGAAIIP